MRKLGSGQPCRLWQGHDHECIGLELGWWRIPFLSHEPIALNATWVAALLCAVSLPGLAQESTDWSTYAAPMVDAERRGPQSDEVYSLIKQEGPWHQLESSREGAAERELLKLLQLRQWSEALALLKTNPDINVKDSLAEPHP